MGCCIQPYRIQIYATACQKNPQRSLACFLPVSDRLPLSFLLWLSFKPLSFISSLFDPPHSFHLSKKGGDRSIYFQTAQLLSSIEIYSNLFHHHLLAIIPLPRLVGLLSLPFLPVTPPLPAYLGSLSIYSSIPCVQFFKWMNNWISFLMQYFSLIKLLSLHIHCYQMNVAFTQSLHSLTSHLLFQFLKSPSGIYSMV